jgi:septal ring factor EnvC (AmiA/AmiB activator)
MRQAAFNERKSLKKTTAIIAALLVAVLALASLAGCNEEKKAREYIEEAREKGKKVSHYQEELQKQGETLAKFYSSIQEDLTPQDAATMKKYFTDLVDLVNKTNESAQDTRVDYVKVTELSDVSKYKKYAENKIETLDLIDRRSKLIKDFYTIVNGALEKTVAGEAVDLEAVLSDTKPIIDERDRLTEEIKKLNEEAVKLANELNLD